MYFLFHLDFCNSQTVETNLELTESKNNRCDYWVGWVYWGEARQMRKSKEYIAVCSGSGSLSLHLFVLLVVLQCHTFTAIILQVVASGDLQNNNNFY